MPKRRIERSPAEEEQFQPLKRQKKSAQQRANCQKIRSEKQNVKNNVVLEYNGNICSGKPYNPISKIETASHIESILSAEVITYFFGRTMPNEIIKNYVSSNYSAKIISLV